VFEFSEHKVNNAITRKIVAMLYECCMLKKTGYSNISKHRYATRQESPI